MRRNLIVAKGVLLGYVQASPVPAIKMLARSRGTVDTLLNVPRTSTVTVLVLWLGLCTICFLVCKQTMSVNGRYFMCK